MGSGVREGGMERRRQANDERRAEMGSEGDESVKLVRTAGAAPCGAAESGSGGAGLQGLDALRVIPQLVAVFVEGFRYAYGLAAVGAKLAAIRRIFTDQPPTLIMEISPSPADLFPAPATEWIISILRDHRT